MQLLKVKVGTFVLLSLTLKEVAIHTVSFSENLASLNVDEFVILFCRISI